MTSEEIDPELLAQLASRVVKRIAGKRPPDQTTADCRQDAILYILERWATGERRECWLIMSAWGRLKDQYARGFQYHSKTKDESIYLANVRAGRRSDEPDVSLRGSYGRTALYGPAERTAPTDQADARLDIEAAIRQLTPAQRAVFTECCINGRTLDSVAADRGCSYYALHCTLARAKKKLRELLGDYGDR